MDYQRKRALINFFSKLDFRVLWVFFGLIIVGVLLFFYQMNRHVDCTSADFEIKAYRRQVGEVIEFKDKTPEAKSWKWDFGDNSPKSSDSSPMHKYAKAGAYTVMLEVNGSCTIRKVLEIRDLGEIIDTLKIPKIYAPKVVSVGQPVEFSYSYMGEGFSWEWSFGESGRMDNTSEFPVYSYSVPGVKRVTLVINGDVAHIAMRDIYVKPRQLINKLTADPGTITPIPHPDTFQRPRDIVQVDPMVDLLKSIPGVPVEVSPTDKEVKEARQDKAPNISIEQFQILLQGVTNQSKSEEDFAKYTGGNYDFPVIKNDDKIITFSQLCKDISGQKIKIISLRLIKNNRNYVEGLEINYKVKKMLIWIRD